MREEKSGKRGQGGTLLFPERNEHERDEKQSTDVSKEACARECGGIFNER